jgi:hypothetical protein
MSLARKQSGQPPSTASKSFAIAGDSANSNLVLELQAQSRPEKPVAGGQAGAKGIGAVVGKDALGQPVPTTNEVDTGPAGATKELGTASAAAEPTVESNAMSLSNNNSVEHSFARRVKKSEFRLNDSVFSPGLQLVDDRDQSESDLNAVAGSGLEQNNRRAAGIGKADSDQKSYGISEKRNEATTRQSNMEDRNIETINNFLGIRSVESGDDQVLRRYLLLVRQSTSAAEGALEAAPPADSSQPDPADK